MNGGVERTVRQSVIDRLIDRQPGIGDAPLTFNQSVTELKRSLLRDIEWLLNTRRIAEPASDAFPEVQRSVYHYGLPDITSISGDPETVQRRLVRSIEESLQLFEPRLTGVRVQAIDSQETGTRQIRFVIEGLLRMEPNPELVVFDTVLDSTSGTFHVGAADA
ncbi:MAG: type VI secretion system baseplate subunit TssE [Longimicrobiales bacterium]